ncbi:hypothetical protein V8G54_023815 [Vigna mungo]|uniref:Uncharacterized protein n=1 Tax=Vigna mungo TaxID=3915 RepID=A0AAQ3RPJ6_VIGMU
MPSDDTNGTLPSPHLSLPPPAKTRRGVTSFEPWNAANNLRLLVPCSDSSSVSVFSWLQGCHVDATFSDIHILDIRPCPTVKSNDKNPNNISSDLIFSSDSYSALLCFFFNHFPMRWMICSMIIDIKIKTKQTVETAHVGVSSKFLPPPPPAMD